MNIRILSTAVCIVLFDLGSIASSQPVKKMPVVGVLLPETEAVYASQVAALIKNLRELSYVLDQNVHLEYKYADGKREKFSNLAGELVALNVDVIVVVGGTLDAAKRATNVIPIVVATAGDLVADGYVASLTRPGGNITGSTNIDSELSAKRLEIFKETLPKFSRVAVISWKGNRQDEEELRETRAAAKHLGVRIQIAGAFTMLTNERAEAVIITNNSFNFAQRRQYFEFALKNRLPTMCGRDAFVEHGCLISYAASRLDAFRRVAYFVDKILKGARPADLPVQQPTKFELVVNTKTAQQIGIKIPPNVLARTGKVIK